MALKDWKTLTTKYNNELYHFKHIKTDGEIFVQSDAYGIAVIVLGKGREYFEKMADAYKYAKKYMRSH